MEAICCGFSSIPEKINTVPIRTPQIDAQRIEGLRKIQPLGRTFRVSHLRGEWV